MPLLHASMFSLLLVFKFGVRVCVDEFREEFLLSFWNLLIDFYLSLSASKIDLVKQWSWVF